MSNRSGLTLIKESQVRRYQLIMFSMMGVIIALLASLHINSRLTLSQARQIADLRQEITTLRDQNGALAAKIQAHADRVAAVGTFIKQAYNVKPDVARRIAEAKIIGSEHYGIRVSLMMALVEQESRFNPRAVSYNGTSFGLTQINLSQWDTELGLNSRNVFDIERNVYGGYEIMYRQLRRTGSYDGALRRYYGATNPALNVEYAHQVLNRERGIRRKLVGVV